MRDPVQRSGPPRPGGGGGDAAGPGQPAEQPGPTGTMSIGEVLGILKPEFPDITVSKIRFLEGAGLVQPDRSASGYRKFSEDDVARLRFVLRAQRDQYLPLRVIRQRLKDLDQIGGIDAAAGLAGPGAGGAGVGSPGVEGAGGAGGAAGSGAAGAGGPGAGAGVAGAATDEAGAGAAEAGSPGAAGSGAEAAGAGTGTAAPAGAGAGAAGAAAGVAGGGTAGAGVGTGAGGAAGGGAGAAAGTAPSARGVAGAFGAAPPSDAQFTRDELCRAAGANVDQLLELESFGLVSARGSGERGAWYGGDDLVLLRLARELADYGLEARHLRMYKLFAEREAALFEQVVAPLVRQRNPEARARARDTIEALAQLGGRMRDLALRSAVHGIAETRDPHR
jgi:MerR family regulatory protein